MAEAYLCDAVRTPIGRYGGALSPLRADDLAAAPLIALQKRNASVDWAKVDDLIYGCANQAGEDNRNVGRMAALLAGLPVSVPGTTVNRLCGSGLDAVGLAAGSIRSGDCELVIAGGVESMSRVPFVMPKAGSAFSRANVAYDTTIGWRFVNHEMTALYGVESIPQTANNVATDHKISCADRDAFALQSQARWAAAQAAGRFGEEIAPVAIPQRKGELLVVDKDEHPRTQTTAGDLARLTGVNGSDLTVTAGNASGVNDAAAALLVASEAVARAHGRTPRARVLAAAAAGVAPRVMGTGPVLAVRRVLEKTGVTLSQMDLIEVNEALAAQALACLRVLGLPDDAAHVNPNGDAIARGHPLGMSGARLGTTAMYEWQRRGGRYALCTMCIGVSQGIAFIIERI